MAKPVTGSVKTTVKLIGLLLVGSAWPLAWLMVTAGGVVSGGLAVNVTVLSVLVGGGVGVAGRVRSPRRRRWMRRPCRCPSCRLTADVVGGAVVGGALRHRGAGGASRAGQGSRRPVAKLVTGSVKTNGEVDRAAAGRVGLAAGLVDGDGRRRGVRRNCRERDGVVGAGGGGVRVAGRW